MSIPFWCLIAAMLLPYAVKVPVAVAQWQLGYDNHHPRQQQARLEGWGRRSLAAHQNSFEILPLFASAVFLAHLTGADPTWSARLAIAFVASRVLYIACYLADLATLRSTVWSVGFAACFVLATLSVWM